MPRAPKNPTPWLAWSELPSMIEEYMDGGACSDIAAAHQHSPKLFAAHLRSIGVYRNKSKAQRLRQRREKRGTHTISDAPWVASELDAITHGPSIALSGFAPMLTVDIRTGKVLLDRMADALEPFDRFPVRRLQA